MTTTTIIILGAVTLIVLWLFGSQKRLVRLDERCEAAGSDVDVLIKRRHDLVPGLVETARGFVTHEKDVLSEVSRAHVEAAAALGRNGDAKAEAKLSASVTSLLSAVQRYPELKADRQFQDLRADLIDAEDRISSARRFHNLSIAEFNSTLRQFPGSVIGRSLRLGRREGFDLGAERVLIDEPAKIAF